MSKNIDFDLDDPLGDLLSDNSNDSFYNDDKGKPATRTQLSSRDTSLDKKKSNLFGLDNDPPRAAVLPNKDVKNNHSGGDWLGLVETPTESKINIIQRPSTSPAIKENADKQNVNSSGDLQNTAIKRAKSSYPDSLNFLDDFGLSDTEPAPISIKPPAKSANKSSTLNDILGKSTSSKKQETPTSVKVENPNISTGYSPSNFLSAPISKNVRLSSSSSKLDMERSLPEAKPKPIKAESAIDLSKPVKKDASNISRRQRGNTDWLGLFPDDDLNAKDPLELKEEIQQNNLPDWLKPTESEEIVSKRSEVINQLKPQPPEDIVENGHLAASNLGIVNPMYSDLTNLMAKQINIPEVLGTGSNLNLLNNSDLEQQSAAICLQQQESQLMVALQLKAQEERLAALHERQEESRKVQREVVSAHRQQLEQILGGQADHRTRLQRIILQHQQRINSHIQSLLRPPSTLEVEGGQNINAVEIDVEVNVPDSVGIGGRSKKEKVSERIQLEQMILNLKENHSREMDMMDTSYRHQIQLVSDSLINVEERLKAENDKLTSYYVMRIERLEEENLKLLQQADDRIKMLSQRQGVEREQMENKHRENMDVLQEQYQRVIQNIRGSSAIEQETVNEATNYSQKLTAMLKDVDKNNEICASFVAKMESKMSDDFVKKENEITTKEKQINYMFETLEIQRRNVEADSQETRSTLKKLEEALRQQIQAIEEEKSSLRLKMLEFDAEQEMQKNEFEKNKKYIDREKDLLMQNVKRSEEHNADTEKHISERITKLEHEQQDIANQRKVVDNLKNRTEALKQNLEKELEDIKRNKESLANNQQNLNLAEMALSARSQELEMLTRSALAKHAVAERKASEATYAQQRYEEKLKRFQEQAISLNAREQLIARDKVALSRERLMFHNLQKESLNSQCGLCKVSMLKQNYMEHQNNDIQRFNGIAETNVNFQTDFLESSVSRDHVDNVDRLNFYPSGQLDDFAKKVQFDISGVRYASYEPGSASGMQFGQRYVEDVPRLEEIKDPDLRSNERPASVFREIIDPRLLLLKLDIEDTTRQFLSS